MHPFSPAFNRRGSELNLADFGHSNSLSFDTSVDVLSVMLVNSSNVFLFVSESDDSSGKRSINLELIRDGGDGDELSLGKVLDLVVAVLVNEDSQVQFFLDLTL